MTDKTPTQSAVQLPANGRFLATGLGFTEGPAVFDDSSVIVTSINRGHIYRVPLDGADSELLVETGGGPNGLAMGPSGEVWITQNGGTVIPSRSTLPARPSLQRWTNGALDTVLDRGVDSPSDCVVGPDGRLWFTDPADHSVEGLTGPGRLRTFDPTTGELKTQRNGLLFPNGLAFGADGTQLYVAETALGVVRRYRVTSANCEPDGWEVRLPVGRPDGLAIDVEGWLWVAGSDGDNVVAIDPSGKVRDQLHFGEKVLVTSVCFAGPELDTLVVTIAKGGTVVAIPARHPGLPLPVRRRQ